MNRVRVIIDIGDMEPEGGRCGSAKRLAARVLVSASVDDKDDAWLPAVEITTPARDHVAGIWEDAIGKVVAETGELLQLIELCDPITEALELAEAARKAKKASP